MSTFQFSLHSGAEHIVVRLSATHLVDRDDLAVRLLDLSELAEEVPEP